MESTHPTSATSGTAPLTLPEKWLLVMGVLLFVIYNCGILTANVLPIKPRDGTVLLIAGVMLPMAFCRLRFCLPMLLLLVLPVLRVLDAAFLHRYDIRDLDNHYASVMQMSNPVVITIMTWLLYSTRMARKFAIYATSGLILVVTAADLYEWMGYAHWTSVPGRISGFLIHPNTAPTYSIMCLTVLYTLNRNFWWNVFCSAITAIPTVLSISRSCMVIYLITISAYLVFSLRVHHKKILLLALIAPPVFLAWVGIVEANARHGRIRPDEFIEGRFDAVFKGDVQGLASQERSKDLRDGWEAVLRSPTWGYGPGASGGEVWQPHNQIVAIWLDLGVFGMIYYVFLILFLVGRSAFSGFKGGYCLLAAVLNIPCQHWLVEMVPYWLVFIVAFGELFNHRFEFRVDSELATEDLSLRQDFGV